MATVRLTTDANPTATSYIIEGIEPVPIKVQAQADGSLRYDILNMQAGDLAIHITAVNARGTKSAAVGYIIQDKIQDPTGLSMEVLDMQDVPINEAGAN